jgi:RNA polymerase sigma-70 factor, ECF subfamily
MLKRYVAAFETYDVEGLTTLMRQDVTFCMPPFSLWLEGPADVRTWMLCLGSGFRGSRLLPPLLVVARRSLNTWPNLEGGHKARALIILELAGDQIVGVNSFLDTEALFRRFDLPLFVICTA